MADTLRYRSGETPEVGDEVRDGDNRHFVERVSGGGIAFVSCRFVECCIWHHPTLYVLVKRGSDG